MNPTDFRYRAISWLRDHMNVETRCLPHDDVVDDDGTAEIDGEIVRASKANPFRGLGLLMLLLSYGLGFTTSDGMSPALQQLLTVGSGLFAALALACFALSFWHARGRRSPVFVELHTEAAPIGEGRIRAVRRKARQADAWVIAAAGFTPEALAMAAEESVRCFGFDDRFVERAAPSSDEPAPLAA